MTQHRDSARSPAPAAAAVAAAGALTAYALAVEPYRLQVTHTELPCPRLPAALDGLSILLLADPHVSRWGKREGLLADLLDSLPEPDVAVWAGDFIHGARGVAPACRLIRNHSRARYARYGILGNAEHKLRGESRRRAAASLREAGLNVLINRSEPLTIDGATITVAGTDDPYYGHADLQATLADATPGRFCLLLAHSPQLVYAAAQRGVDVMLSGHTHGGQVRLPLVGPIKTQNPLGRALDYGLWDRTRLRETLGRDPACPITLYISRGIGVARVFRLPIFPRFLCRPEVAWLTLRRRDEG